MAVTIGPDGFSYTPPGEGDASLPEWKQGAHKLGYEQLRSHPLLTRTHT